MNERKKTDQGGKNAANNQLTLGSLFDGIGVFPLAASQYDIVPIWASEVEKGPISITKRHFPTMQHIGDITKIKGAETHPVDIITFGSPCQNLSSIGNRTGLAGESSSLFFHAIRIINEMKEATNRRYPTFAIWENVAGAFSSNDGLDFRAVLSEFAKCEIPMPVTGKWANAGMVCGQSPQIAWRVLDSQYFAIPQRRKRIFLLADYRGQRSTEILFNPAHLHEAIKHGKESPMSVSGINRNYAHQTRRHTPQVYSIQERKMRGAVQFEETKTFLSAVGRADSPCPTLLASDPQTIALNYLEDQSKNHIRKITPLEAERLMGLPDNWTLCGFDGKIISDSARYKALGNSIALPCAQYIMYGISQAMKRKEVIEIE